VATTASAKATRTLEQRQVAGSLVKPGELIDVFGGSDLTLADRRTYNLLIAGAWDHIGDPERVHRIPKSELLGSHESTDRLSGSIERLMRTIVRIRVEAEGKPAIRRVQLLAPTTEQTEEGGILFYRFPVELVEIIKDSGVFGRLKRDVMFGLSSKYALALYEMGEKRRHLSYRWSEVFSIEEIRDLLGVADGELERFANLNAWALKPAAVEVNALADFGVKLEPIKQGRKVVSVKFSWWAKSETELREAFSELRRHRTGRKARISGKVEAMT